MSRYSHTAAFTLALSIATQVAWSQPLPPAPPQPPTTSLPAPPPAAPATQPALPPPAPRVTPPASATQLPPPPPSTAPAAPGTAWTTPQPPRRPGLFRERLRMLDRYLVPLPERSRDSRITSGLINLALGAGFIGLGFAFQSADSGLGGPVAFQNLLWSQGGFSVASGAVELLWTPARERIAQQYALLPNTTARQRRDRVHFGEQALDDIAADGARRRVLKAVASVVWGLGSIGIFYREQIFDGQPMPEPLVYNYIVIGSVGLQALTSLIGIFSRSEEERLRDTYRRELQLLRDTQDVNE